VRIKPLYTNRYKDMCLIWKRVKSRNSHFIALIGETCIGHFIIRDILLLYYNLDQCAVALMCTLVRTDASNRIRY